MSLFEWRETEKGLRPGRRLVSTSEAARSGLVAVFLPVAVLTVGMVLDLGMCTSPGCSRRVRPWRAGRVIELDWDALASGDVRIDPAMGRRRPSVASDMKHWKRHREFSSRSCFPALRIRKNQQSSGVPLQVGHFLRFLSSSGIPCFTSSEGSVVRRTKW